MTYRDRTYHGIPDGPESNRSEEEEWQPAPILVEEAEFGAPNGRT
ncbi:hypothetical protein [Streptomyces virginiae]